MPQTDNVKRGFNVCCLACGEEGCISIDADDLLIRCLRCEEEFTGADIRERLSGWDKLLSWLDTAPLKG